MKVWITRPEDSVCYLRGLSNILVWVDKPFFDHRPNLDYGAIVHAKTGRLIAVVGREQGWYASTSPVRAKGFLRQNEAVCSTVWNEVVKSMRPRNGDIDIWGVGATKALELVTDHNLDNGATTHWKRFLLEIDLETNTVSRIQAESLLCSKLGKGLNPINPDIGISCLYLDEDLRRPFTGMLPIDYRLEIGAAI